MNRLTKQLLCTGLISMVLWGCGSSAEYTTAKMAIKEENWEKAEEYLNKALEVEPENAEVMVQIGYHVHAKKGEWTKMNEMFDKALSVDPAAKMEGQPIADVIESYKIINWTEKYNKGVNSYNKGLKSKNKGDLETSLSFFLEALAINPEDAQTNKIVSENYSSLENKELALDYLYKAVALDSNNASFNNRLGTLLSASGENKKALIYISKARELEPNNSQIVEKLALLHYSTGDTVNAIETFNQAIKVEGDKRKKSDLYFNLGVLNNQIGNFQEAEDSFMMAFDLNPEDTEALVGIAQTFENAEKWRRASKFYRELITLEPDNPEHYRGMIRTLMKQGDPDGADRYYKKMISIGN